MEANKNDEYNQEQTNSFSAVEHQHRGQMHTHNFDWTSSTPTLTTTSNSYPEHGSNTDEYKGTN